jgi:hypothetical protein
MAVASWPRPAADLEHALAGRQFEQIDAERLPVRQQPGQPFKIGRGVRRIGVSLAEIRKSRCCPGLRH